MEDYVRAAVQRGLRHIVFLEHLEVGIRSSRTTWLSEDEFLWYFKEGRRLKNKYREKITISLGVEVGYNPRYLGGIQSYLGRHQWDRIGISYHFLEVDGRHYNMVSSRKSNLLALGGLGVDNVLRSYLIGLREAVELLPGDVLCHLDAALRYHPDVHIENHIKLVSEIFEVMAQKKMALELNTSGYRIRNEPFPALSLVREALKRGIPLMAGSDAHRPEDVGRYFERLADLDLRPS